MVGLLTSDGVDLHIVEHAFCKVVEGDALQETSRDDAIGVNIGAWDRNSSSSDLSNDWKGHLIKRGLMANEGMSKSRIVSLFLRS